MKTKKIVLSLCVTIFVMGSKVKAMETSNGKDYPASTCSTTSSSSTTAPLNDVIEEKKENPFTTGFWDKLIHNPSLSNEEKLKMADERISRLTSLYELFIAQMNAFKQNITYKSDTYSGALIQPVDAIITFFECKLERIKDARFQLLSRLDAQHDKELDLTDKSYCYKTYSGKLNGQPEQQAKYATLKYRAYSELLEFINLHNIGLPSLNPIIYKTIMDNVQEILKKREELEKHVNSKATGNWFEIYNKNNIAPQFQALATDSLCVHLNKEDTLEYFITERKKKWEGRLDSKQKMEIFIVKKSLPVVLAQLTHIPEVG